MVNDIKVSKRLENIASFLPEGANFADIGSDHAYLPCYICINDSKARAIAGEVNLGPYQSAVATVEKYQLADVIDVRLGNGLEILEKEEVDQIVIAGMGGSLIHAILEAGKDKLTKVQRIIVQPNIDEVDVRKWFNKNGYKIVHEIIMEENGHIYEIIVADYRSSRLLTDQEMLFGPLLLQEASELFLRKWQAYREKQLRIITQMQQAKEQNESKINMFQTELAWIEEVLRNGRNFNK